MAHDIEGTYTPKKPTGWIARLRWWFEWGAPLLHAPHGNECEICQDYFNMDDIGVRAVKPWPPPPADDARFRMVSGIEGTMEP